VSAANLEGLFPDLKRDGYSITSNEDPRYNCVAWANDDNTLWWDHIPGPGRYWPQGVPRSSAIDAYVALFVSQGYEVATTSAPEEGYEKVAILMRSDRRFSHAARFLPTGPWCSKLGRLEDVEHNFITSLQSEYGLIHCYMKRRLSPD
jgi:hypothetical protein